MAALRWALNHVQPPFDFGEYRKAAELLGDTFVPGSTLDIEVGAVLEHKREIENIVIDIEKVLKGEPLSDNALNNLHLIQQQINEFRELKRKDRST